MFVEFGSKSQAIKFRNMNKELLDKMTITINGVEKPLRWNTHRTQPEWIQRKVTLLLVEKLKDLEAMNGKEVECEDPFKGTVLVGGFCVLKVNGGEVGGDDKQFEIKIVKKYFEEMGWPTLGDTLKTFLDAFNPDIQ